MRSCYSDNLPREHHQSFNAQYLGGLSKEDFVGIARLGRVLHARSIGIVLGGKYFRQCINTGLSNTTPLM